MTHIPRVRLILVLAALLALLVVPMAGARTLGSPSLHSADGGWLGAALRWARTMWTSCRPPRAHPEARFRRSRKTTTRRTLHRVAVVSVRTGASKPLCL